MNYIAGYLIPKTYRSGSVYTLRRFWRAILLMGIQLRMVFDILLAISSGFAEGDQDERRKDDKKKKGMERDVDNVDVNIL